MASGNDTFGWISAADSVSCRPPAVVAEIGVRGRDDGAGAEGPGEPARGVDGVTESAETVDVVRAAFGNAACVSSGVGSADLGNVSIACSTFLRND